MRWPFLLFIYLGFIPYSLAQNNSIFGFGLSTGYISVMYLQNTPAVSNIFGYGDYAGDAHSLYSQVNPSGSIFGFGQQDGSNIGCYQSAGNTPIWGWGDGSGAISVSFSQAGESQIFGYGVGSGYTTDCMLSPVVLPVFDVDFEVIKESQRNEVWAVWLVTHNPDIFSFVLERSANQQEWSQVASYLYLGNNTMHYRHQDVFPQTESPFIYYRLRVLSVNGELLGSYIKSVKLTDQPIHISYNNPVSNKLHIYGDIDKNDQITIYDMFGRNTELIGIYTPDGWFYDTGSLREGYYVVEVVSELLSGYHVFKLLKQ